MNMNMNMKQKVAASFALDAAAFSKNQNPHKNYKPAW